MVIVSNAVAAIVFAITGLLALGLTFTGRLSVANMDVFTKTITDALSGVNGILGNNIFLNILFAGGILYFIYWISKKV